ncbi:MAG: Holliday junction branch migration protein RuvA [Planctomycetota bacterium]
MIESLRGTVSTCVQGGAVLELGGVGLRVRVPSGTAETLKPGQEARLACHLLLKDERFHLYGFASGVERDLFRVLLGVSGLGPEKALALLSARSPAAIAAAVRDSDPAPFQVVRGIGNRLSQRIVLELQGKLDSLALEGLPGSDPPPDRQQTRDLHATLMKLGYSKAQVERASKVAFASVGDEATIEELVRAALRALQQPL